MKIQAVKDNLDSSIKKLVPIQALSSSMDNLLVLLEEKAFISLRGKWFWLADRKSILNTLELTLKSMKSLNFMYGFLIKKVVCQILM